jgi:cyclopropane-fatty-acyl-phospholipid synthase
VATGAQGGAVRLTCAWLERFDARAMEVRALGFDEHFRRMWRYYLAYCIAGFRNGMIDVRQVALR